MSFLLKKANAYLFNLIFTISFLYMRFKGHYHKVLLTQ